MKITQLQFQAPFKPWTNSSIFKGFQHLYKHWFMNLDLWSTCFIFFPSLTVIFMQQSTKARTYFAINLILTWIISHSMSGFQTNVLLPSYGTKKNYTVDLDTNPKNTVLYLSQVGGRVFDSYVTGLSKCVGLPFFIRVFTWSPSGRVRSWAMESTLLGPTGFTLTQTGKHTVKQNVINEAYL